MILKKIVDLKDVGDMLVKVQRQMEDLTKSKSLFGRITDNIPILAMLTSEFIIDAIEVFAVVYVGTGAVIDAAEAINKKLKEKSE